MDGKPVGVECPAGEGLYWAERISTLLGPEQVQAVRIGEAVDGKRRLPYLGELAWGNDADYWTWRKNQIYVSERQAI
jgi:hypothetical protein